jgi:hypothetical protein
MQLRQATICPNDQSHAENHADSTSRSKAQKRRQYNREYMRRWRQDPVHRYAENAHRLERSHERKATTPTWRVERANPLCGFCGKSPSVTHVARLRISESTPDGYVKVRIPYCGQC